MENQLVFDKEYLRKFTTTRMPFGKYKGVLLIDVPEEYIVWFENEGFPDGEFGKLMRELYEIKVNGLEYLFKNI